MKLVANRINQTHLRDILPEISEDNQVDNVLAAIAYGSSASDETKDLVGHALGNKLRLDLWMRYDETVPVSVPFLSAVLDFTLVLCTFNGESNGKYVATEQAQSNATFCTSSVTLFSVDNPTRLQYNQSTVFHVALQLVSKLVDT